MFQPTEFAKIGLVIFLASYLRDTRAGARVRAGAFLGVTLPPLKQFGPVLVIWGIAMLILVCCATSGSSLMFYGGLLAVLYVATNRLSFVVVGLIAFGDRAWYLGTHIPHIDARVQDVAAPVQSDAVPRKPARQLPARQREFAQAAGGPVRAGLRPGRCSPLPKRPGRCCRRPQTDMIYAVITDELGLFGACALLITYLLLSRAGSRPRSSPRTRSRS